MGKMKEATMEIVEYVIENYDDYFAYKPHEDEVFEFVSNMDEETFFVTLMLATPTKDTHAV